MVASEAMDVSEAMVVSEAPQPVGSIVAVAAEL